MAQMVLSLLAIFISFFCVMLLRRCWRKFGGRYSFLRCLSWFGMLWSTIFWIKSHGVEFGLVYAASVLTLFAWCIIYIDSCLQSIKTGSKKKSVNKKKAGDKEIYNKVATGQTRLSLKKEKRKIWCKRLWLFVLCGPFTLIAMCLLSVLVCFLIPVDNSIRLVFAAFLYPLFIGICIYWLCAKDALLRHTIVLSTLSIVSVLSLYVFSL